MAKTTPRKSPAQPKNAAPEPSALIEPGQAAPDFSLPDQSGQVHQLKQYRGQWVVLYFYPKDDTPGCTREACSFRDRSAEMTRHGAVVLGLSPDSTVSHQRFAGKYRLPFPLLSDPDKAVLARYGVWQEKHNYGRTYLGVVRTTYLIAPDGKVARRWDKVKVDGHDQAVLAALKEGA